MNTINRGLWVNETNDAYEMRVKNSCFNARANVRKRPCKIVVFYRTVNIIIARPINFLVFLLACVRSFANYYKTFGEEIICSRAKRSARVHYVRTLTSFTVRIIRPCINACVLRS